MNTEKASLSGQRICRLRAQGYTCQSEEELNQLAFGIRFAYRLCAVILSIAIVMVNIPLLVVMLILAFLGVLLPNHPFDYIYNHVLSKRMGKPSIPERSNQLKFACTVATLWIGMLIYLFFQQYNLAGYIAGAILVGVALMVGAFDVCIPSIIYNRFLKLK
jgi:hypothetical protein